MNTIYSLDIENTGTITSPYDPNKDGRKVREILSYSIWKENPNKSVEHVKSKFFNSINESTPEAFKIHKITNEDKGKHKIFNIDDCKEIYNIMLGAKEWISHYNSGDLETLKWTFDDLN